jgi:hypothetical protein
MRGMYEAEGAMCVRSRDGLTLVLNDCVFDAEPARGVGPVLLSHLLGIGPGPRVARFIRWGFVEDPHALAEQLRSLAETPGLVRLVVAHDRVETGPAAAQALVRAADSLGAA